MYGAFYGDIIGSIYEFNNIKTKDFPLFQNHCFMTDDSFMTIAVGSACLEYINSEERDLDVFRQNVVREMHRIGREYPHASYGGRFAAWLEAGSTKPYRSFGNGSAMRVSPCGWVCDTLEETLALAAASADVTHNHPEGIKGAQAVAVAIFLARTGSSKEDIRIYITDTFGYDLSRTCDEIRPYYRFDETCQDTVPEAIIAFLESTTLEDAARNAISLGGDSDTLAAITCSIAEAFYPWHKTLYRPLRWFMARDLKAEERSIVYDFLVQGVLRRVESRSLNTENQEAAVRDFNLKGGGNDMTYDRDAWLKEVIARNKTKTPAERAARLAELNAKLEAGTATAQDKDEIVSMPHPCK